MINIFRSYLRARISHNGLRGLRCDHVPLLVE